MSVHHDWKVKESSTVERTTNFNLEGDLSLNFNVQTVGKLAAVLLTASG